MKPTKINNLHLLKGSEYSTQTELVIFSSSSAQSSRLSPSILKGEGTRSSETLPKTRLFRSFCSGVIPMEKPPKGKSSSSSNKKSLFKFVTFQNPPFSPTRDSNARSSSSEVFGKISTAKSHAKRASFSGPIVPLIPKEVRHRRRFKNDDDDDDDASSLDAPQEPTSPKVSCMGQIKLKNKIKKKKKKKSEEIARVKEPSSGSFCSEEKKPKSRIFRRIFSRAGAGRKSGAPGVPTEDRGERDTSGFSEERAPSLGQMRRFASGRNALASFDWAAQVAPVDAAEQRNCYSDDEDRDRDRDRVEGDDNDDDEAIVPFSAPISLGGGVEWKAKQEVNLWKRRTMAPPQPLRLQHPH